jgi:hypothetical protein
MIERRFSMPLGEGRTAKMRREAGVPASGITDCACRRIDILRCAFFGTPGFNIWLATPLIL